MMTDFGADNESYVIPAQTLRGSRQDMLSTIDQAISGLLALRHLVAGEALVLPEMNDTRAAHPDPRGVHAPIARVARIFSNLMRQHD